jgi:hypothetical protein
MIAGTGLAESMRDSLGSGLKAWNAMVIDTPLSPGPSALERLALGGASTLSMVETTTLFRRRQQISAFRPDEYVVLGRDTFLACLAPLGRGIVAKWEGAWERLERIGPDAASQAAHSLVELIDRSLRSAAPDRDVLQWHDEEGLPESALYKGKPTRRLRLQYLVRNRESDRAPAEILFTSLLKLMEHLQDQKHAADDNDVEAIRRLVPGIEAILYFVFAYE